MNADSLDPDEVVVEAEYFTSTGDEKPSLRKLHTNLLTVMLLKGFMPREPQKVQLHSQTVTYIRQVAEPDKPWGWKLKNRLGFADEDELRKETYLDQLRATRDDVVFEINFRFVPVRYENETGNENGVRIEVTARPALLLKHEQLGWREEYNAKNAVRTCKGKINNIATEMPWSILYEPYTAAEALSSTLGTEVRQKLEQLTYGTEVIQFSDEGDECMQYGLLHSALSSYIHAIEWTIICHLESADDYDLIEKEQTDMDGAGLQFGQLIDQLDHHGESSQKTIEDLRRYKTDRRWMGHHKSGELAESNVMAVKDRLGLLVEELFLTRTKHPQLD